MPIVRSVVSEIRFVDRKSTFFAVFTTPFSF